MSRFDATSTADDVISGISLAGKLAVVTGASSGLGVETARVLSTAGATVLLVARDQEKLEAVAQDLRQQIRDMLAKNMSEREILDYLLPAGSSGTGGKR